MKNETEKLPESLDEEFESVDDEIELFDGRLVFRIEIEHDPFYGAPWQEFDSSGEVFTQRDSYKKAPGEKFLHESGREILVYDYVGAINNLKKQGLKGKDAARVADSEFDYFQRWVREQWYWVTVSVVARLDGNEIARESIGGIESDSEAVALDCCNENISSVFEATKTYFKGVSTMFKGGDSFEKATGECGSALATGECGSAFAEGRSF